MTSVSYQDVMVLNDIIDQVSERPMSKATHFSSAYQVILVGKTLDLPGHDVCLQDDDDEGPKMKDIMFDCIKRTSDVMCVWDCCWLWIRTAEVINPSKYFLKTRKIFENIELIAYIQFNTPA